jgi:hypothetical protein
MYLTHRNKTQFLLFLSALDILKKLVFQFWTGAFLAGVPISEVLVYHSPALLLEAKRRAVLHQASYNFIDDH